MNTSIDMKIHDSAQGGPVDRHPATKSPVKHTRRRLVGGRRLKRHGELPHQRFEDILESLCSSDRDHPRASEFRPDGLKRSIGFHSHLLHASGRLKGFDREDIEQELILKALDASRRIDPMRGTAGGYLKTVVANHACRIRERALIEEKARSAICRRVRLECCDRELTWEKDRLAWDRCEDAMEIVSGLDARDRCLAELLMQCTVAEAARQMGVSRSTLRERIRRLAKAFGA